MNVRDLRILVTGATSGLGRQFCLPLCGEGAREPPWISNRAGLDALAREIKEDLGTEIRTYVANVAKQDEVIRAVKRAAADLGSLNGLINSAGFIVTASSSGSSRARTRSSSSLSINGRW